MGDERDDAEGLLVADYPLQPGDSYCDPHRNVNIQILSADGEAAQIRVTRGACTPPQLLPLGAACSQDHVCQSGECVAGACYTSPSLVDTGDAFACASFRDGKLRCWGRNDEGQLGISDPGPIGDSAQELGLNMRAVPLSGRVRSFSLGLAHGCALLDNDRVECWGRNLFGQLGAGDTQPHVGSVVSVDLNGTPVQIAAGANFNCALMLDETVKCWGDNSYGKLGIGGTENVGDEPLEMGGALRAVGLSDVWSIAAGGHHTCARLGNGEIRCWGLAAMGQLGFSAGNAFGDQITELTPPAVSLGDNFSPSSVTAGAYHTCALSGQTIKCWGSNAFGQLGYGDRVSRGVDPATMGNSLPRLSVGTVQQIDAGGNVTCAYLSNRTIKCWGAATTGSLGQPALTAAGTNHLGDAPNEVGATLPAIDLGFSPLILGVGLRTSGRITCSSGNLASGTSAIKCWGSNSYGELGVGDVATRGHNVADMGANLPAALLP